MPQLDSLRRNSAGTSPLSASRALVLRALQSAGRPIGVADVAAQVHLHVNTVRFHLDALVEQGFAERTREDRVVPGRPRALYLASPDAPHAGPRNYRLLAEILTSYIAGGTRQPEKAAVKAGLEWGQFLAVRPAPFRRVDAAGATRQLVEALDEIGFAPEPVTSGRKRRILLHQCPFREAAEQHSAVVCSIHLGLMQGFLSALGAPIEASRLEPFVEPGLCVAHLSARQRNAQTRARPVQGVDGGQGLT